MDVPSPTSTDHLREPLASENLEGATPFDLTMIREESVGNSCTNEPRNSSIPDESLAVEETETLELDASDVLESEQPDIVSHGLHSEATEISRPWRQSSWEAGEQPGDAVDSVCQTGESEGIELAEETGNSEEFSDGITSAGSVGVDVDESHMVSMSSMESTDSTSSMTTTDSGDTPTEEESTCADNFDSPAFFNGTKKVLAANYDDIPKSCASDPTPRRKVSLAKRAAFSITSAEEKAVRRRRSVQKACVTSTPDHRKDAIVQSQAKMTKLKAEIEVLEKLFIELCAKETAENGGANGTTGQIENKSDIIQSMMRTNSDGMAGGEQKKQRSRSVSTSTPQPATRKSSITGANSAATSSPIADRLATTARAAMYAGGTLRRRPTDKESKADSSSKQGATSALERKVSVSSIKRRKSAPFSNFLGGSSSSSGDAKVGDGVEGGAGGQGEEEMEWDGMGGKVKRGFSFSWLRRTSSTKTKPVALVTQIHTTVVEPAANVTA